MSVFIDRSFLLQVSPKLQKFARKKDDLYNFRCPICGDSQKNKSKCRGYVYRKKDDYFYMCHNCGVSTSFYNFLKQVDENLAREYTLERYRNGQTANTNYPKPVFTEHPDIKEKPIFKETLSIPSIKSLDTDHHARVYVENRMIPEDFFSDLYYAEDFKGFIGSLGLDTEKLHENDMRLVIPFYDGDKKLIALQGRSLSQSKLRYITLKLHEDNPKVFGLDRVNLDEKVLVVEGPIDSMFLDNAIATCDSNLETSSRFVKMENIVLIFDNEPRNEEIVKKMERAIDNHYNIVIWPEMIEEKDINEMILNGGWTKEELLDIIEKHTFVNLRAKMEFINWKKV